MRRRRAQINVTFLLAGLLAAGIGCGGDSRSVRGLSLREGARRISQLRNEADACLDRYTQSEGSSLEDLECFTEKQYQTTQLQSATDCPLCYLNYGRGLRLLALDSQMLLVALENRLDDADPSEDEEIESKIAEVRERMVEYFTRSTETFEIYLRAPSRHYVHCYRWLADNSQAIGDYERAFRYQTDYIRLLGDEANPAFKQELQRNLRRYRALLDNQRLKEDAKDGAGDRSGN